MAAPALVALAHGSRDPRSAETIKALVAEVKAMRPDLRIETAFLDLCQAVVRHGRGPAGEGGLRRDRRRAAAPHRGLPRQGGRPRRRSPPRPRVTRDSRSGPPGCSAWRPRSSRCSTCACASRSRTARVRELDALVLAAAGSSDPLANQAVARLARTWGTRHKLPVTAAFASAAPPAAGEAVRAFRAEGRRHIAVASFFLAPGHPARPGSRARPRGRRRRRLRAARRPPRGRPRDPGPLRRRCGGARARLIPEFGYASPGRGITRPGCVLFSCVGRLAS